MSPSSPRLLLDERIRLRIDGALESGKMAGAWLLTGPKGIGKKTLALTIARSLLSLRDRLEESDQTTDALVENRGHPDLFILSRAVNEKTGRLQAEIGVESVREMTAGLHLTSTTGRRVVIIDLADHMGRAASNALLKTLEEPPAGATMLLLSVAPGRLLPTIKSRCRHLALPPVPAATLKQWAETYTELPKEQVHAVVDAAAGRPGRVLDLLTETGMKARELADDFFSSVDARDTVRLTTMAANWSKRDADDAWGDARELVLDKIAAQIRQAPEGAETPRLIEAFEMMRDLSHRAVAVNSDRQQTILMMATTLRQARGTAHARR